MTNYEVFTKYLKHHLPSFIKVGNKNTDYRFCENQSCNTCGALKDCKGNNIPTIQKKIALKYMEDHPENCI